jgi:hypothetical protein
MSGVTQTLVMQSNRLSGLVRGSEGWHMKRVLTVLSVVLIAGCSTHQTSAAPSTPPTTTPAASPTSSAPPAPSAPPTDTPTAAPAGQCSDSDLGVTNGEVASANTLRHVTVSFKNTSSHPCTLTGYPGADLVTAAGGVLVHVARRPANAAHHLTLNPGDVANANVESYAIDTTTGNDCLRVGTLVVTPPNGFQSHLLPVNLPICNATISSVD